MKKALIVVDMQNDFIDGSLGTKEARAIVPNVVEKIKSWSGIIIATRDTHTDAYLSTREGKYLPVNHCIRNTDGHSINKEVKDAIYEVGAKEKEVVFINKNTFGSTVIPELLRTYDEGIESVEIIGLCTDICVVSNAMLIKANFPEMDITVDASCCAGVTPESHYAALTTMKMCQINVIGEQL